MTFLVKKSIIVWGLLSRFNLTGNMKQFQITMGKDYSNIASGGSSRGMNGRSYVFIIEELRIELKAYRGNRWCCNLSLMSQSGEHP